MRQAFNFAFAFEEMNKQNFFGQYKRIASISTARSWRPRGCRKVRSSKSWEDA